MLMFKKGDTLVEVMLAIGIFSMIAIAITAVMSSGSSGAQAALETTLTREEVDTQAEAIRFIQSSYAVDKTAADDTYAKLWKDIIARAAPASEDILQYNPSSCSAVYSESSPVRNYAFVINPRALSTFSESAESGGGSTAALVTMNTTDGSGNKIMQTTSTYPRLVFGSTGGSLVSNGNDNLVRAEGIYVVAVRDQGTSNVIDAAGQEKDTGFYDFYIRSCWYGTDADQPTTISTVIRLYDPDAITTAGLVKVKFANPGILNPNVSSGGPHDGTVFTKNQEMYDNGGADGKKVTLPAVASRKGWTFVWEVVDMSASGGSSLDHPASFTGGSVVLNNEPGTKTYTLQGKWVHTEYYIQYKLNYAEGTDFQRTCYEDDGSYPCIAAEPAARSGYSFGGWCSQYVETNNSCRSNLYHAGDVIPITSRSPRYTPLYAMWEIHPDTVFLIDSSGSMSAEIYSSKAAIVTMTSQTTLLNGKVALFEYALGDSQFVMHCGFSGATRCTSANIGSHVDAIIANKGNENLPLGLNKVLETLRGQWTEDRKVLVILTDEAISAGSDTRNNATRITSFINSVKSQNITPLRIYIITTSGLVNDYKKIFQTSSGANRFAGYDVSLEVIAFPTGYTTCNTPVYSQQTGTCKAATDYLVDRLRSVVYE